MKEAYGEDVTKFGEAYEQRWRGMAFGAPIIEGYVHSLDEVRSSYAQALVEAIEKQPANKRAEFVNNFLTDLDKLTRRPSR